MFSNTFLDSNTRFSNQNQWVLYKVYLDLYRLQAENE